MDQPGHQMKFLNPASKFVEIVSFIENVQTNVRSVDVL